MTDSIKKKCLTAYYNTDIEPTLQRLHQVKDIVSNFEVEGANRLMSALKMKHMDLEEIERLTEYISQARDKMSKELDRLHRYEKDFNKDFATDHNDYYNSVSEILRHMRSHMSPLKTILKKLCPRQHPTTSEGAAYDIPQKSVFEESTLSKGIYEGNLFDLSTYPPIVQGLFNELIGFFKAEEECMNLCTEILQEEMDIRKDPVRSKCSLDTYRRKAYKRLRYQIFLLNDETINCLKEITPAYRRYLTYPSDEGFAQGEFHKHNHADMEHFCIIECLTETAEITIEEKALWGNNPKTIKKIKYVISHFDELLPPDFRHKNMGLYEYIFCKWALQDNVKKALEYFIAHYKGMHKVVKYAAVNKHSVDYDKNSDIVKKFISNIKVLFADSNDEDLMEEIA